MLERFDRSDHRFFAVCAAIFIIGLGIGLVWFGSAFPEASIQFRYDRGSSGDLATEFLQKRNIDLPEFTHATKFAWDDAAKIFLERTIGLKQANELMRDDVRVWFWQHRWFKPLEVEEVNVQISPTGRLVGYTHKIPEDAERSALAKGDEERIADGFLESIGVEVSTLRLVSRSEQQRPNRVDTTLTWESRDLRPGDAPYKYSITFLGSEIGSYREWLDVPESFTRGYTELRSRNETTGLVDSVFFLLTIVFAVGVFIIRLRRGDVHVRFTVWSGIIGGVLVTLVALNSFPVELANYNTDSSFTAFVSTRVVLAIVQGLAIGFFLMILVGAGDVLYRERLPNQLGIPTLFRRRSVRSKRFFKGFVLGYTLFAAFLAYQVVFYLVAARFGAWAPAEIPYDDILNTAIPWASVLFIGFFPAMSEEYMSRAFSIPFFEKFLKSRFAAIVVAGFIWGFGHAAYPNQPFYIRGLEVGIAGVVIGLLMFRFGLLPLLVWHYTVDALYTSLLLFRSGNAYYITSAAIASFVFLVPPAISLILYFRNGGFEPDDELSNSSLPVSRIEAAPPAIDDHPPLPAGMPVTRRWIVVAGVAVILAGIGMATSPATLDEVIDYRITRDRAEEIARAHLPAIGIETVPEKAVTLPTPGFRSWDERSALEEGGAPGDYDPIAAEYILREGDPPVETLVEVQKERVRAATWVTRLFTPGVKEEILVEVDPRNPDAEFPVLAFHRYLSENEKGPELGREEAEAIADRSFETYDVDRSRFAVQEALSFRQPNRLDWLFHYEEKDPLAGEAFRRISVRVAGDRVSEFATTVKIPEKVERESRQQTFVNAAFLIARIVGLLAILSMVVAGVVTWVRDAKFRWRRSIRWTLYFSPLPIVSAALQTDNLLSQYQTSIQWPTFMIIMGVSLLVLVATQIVIVWLALSVIETIFPFAPSLLTREGRSRFGRSAVLLTIVAISILAIVSSLENWVPHLMPSRATLPYISPSPLVATAAPILPVMWRALFQAIIGAASVASLFALIEAQPRWRVWLHIALFASLVFIGLDSSASVGQIPVAVVEALVSTLAIYGIVLLVFRGNYLAYPLAILTSIFFRQGLDMLRNHRIDLQVYGWLAIAIAAAALIWCALENQQRDESPIPSI